MTKTQVLKQSMKAKGWDPKDDGAAQLAAATGIPSSQLGRYIRGEVEIGAKNAPIIAEALGISVVELLYGKESTGKGKAA